MAEKNTLTENIVAFEQAARPYYEFVRSMDEIVRSLNLTEAQQNELLEHLLTGDIMHYDSLSLPLKDALPLNVYNNRINDAAITAGREARNNLVTVSTGLEQELEGNQDDTENRRSSGGMLYQLEKYARSANESGVEQNTHYQEAVEEAADRIDGWWGGSLSSAIESAQSVSLEAGVERYGSVSEAEATLNTLTAETNRLIAAVPAEHHDSLGVLLDASVVRRDVTHTRPAIASYTTIPSTYTTHEYVTAHHIRGYAELKQHVPNLDDIIEARRSQEDARRELDRRMEGAGLDPNATAEAVSNDAQEEVTASSEEGDAVTTPTANDNALITLVNNGGYASPGVHKRGLSADAVERLQQTLYTGGFYAVDATAETEVDGRYGSRTAAAVRGLQAKYGLEQDGVIGPDTLAALQIEEAQQALEVTPPLSSAQQAVLGSELADIAAIQALPNAVLNEVRGLLSGIEQAELSENEAIQANIPTIQAKIDSHSIS